MFARLGRTPEWVAVAVGCLIAAAPAAHAEDFFSALFGGIGARPEAPATPLPYASEANPMAPSYEGIRPRFSQPARPRVSSYGGSEAFCVRSCDGRYFPVNGPDRQSRAAACDSFCPASKTEMVYGSTIDKAATDSGKPYSELPNAFRYRNEIVAGCTCNGKDQIGLAPVRIEDDPTLRKGDLVAGADGLLVAGRNADKRGAALNLSPVSKTAPGRDRPVPVVAAE
jgi:hypothetical protein